MHRALFHHGILLLGILLGQLCFPALTQADPPKKWNIISIVTDDQGRWGVGAYGNKEVKTPNMDRIAREGALFVNAYTPTPVCSPSRASFLSGRYCTEVGITDWISPPEANAGLGLANRFPTWPGILQRHGYVTGLIGKWHLGMQPQYHPTKMGFDHFYGFLGGGNQPMNPILEVRGKETKLKGPLPDLLTDNAIDFVKKNQKRPFALLLHFRAPHLPYGPVPKVDSDPFQNLDPTIPKFKGLDIPQVKNWTRDYYASIHSVDRNIGQLLQVLDELGLAENTIIIFTSDHGYNIGHHGIHTKGNGHWIVGGVWGPKRPNMWETSMKVPLLIRWPGVVRPGTRIEEMTTNIDMFPSVLGMLKVPVPGDCKLQGLDFSPLLRGEKTHWRQELFGQYDLHNNGLAFMRTIRNQRYALIRHHFSNSLDELYDLQTDPGESKNLYNNQKYRKVRNELEGRLVRWQQAIDDPILRYSPLEPRNRQPAITKKR